jgi:hypothetical protein
MFYGSKKFSQNLNPWEPQLVGNDCNGFAPVVTDMFIYTACPIQTTTLPGDFCQSTPRPPTKPFKVRVCLKAAVLKCSCKTKVSKMQCLTVLRNACKAKYVAVGGSPSSFASLSRAARRRKCGE